MEPLSKASLNNQIVSMRHIVRKSKVHTINKLSREAKKLKEKKGSEEQINKNKKKAERLISELMVLKKLNDDIVSKYALQNEIPASKILNSLDTTLETRARARLAGHKFITDAVQSFRNKYPDWKCSITDLMNDLGAKYRAKKKPNVKKPVKVKTGIKSKISNKNVDTVTDIEEFEDIQSKSENDSENEGYETNPSESEDYSESDHERDEKISPFKNNISSEDQNNELKPVFPKEPKKFKGEKKVSSKCDEIIKSKVDINDSETQVPLIPNTQLTLTNKFVDQKEVKLNKKSLKRKTESNVSSKDDFKKKRNMIDEVTPICETVDSFFMTADDKDYMSVYKPPPSKPYNSEERPKLEYSKPTKKEIFVKGKKVIVGKSSFMGNRRERRQQQVEQPADTVLHPSWEAKRKQKSLAKFEGKKITFDDQD